MAFDTNSAQGTEPNVVRDDGLKRTHPLLAKVGLALCALVAIGLFAVNSWKGLESSVKDAESADRLWAQLLETYQRRADLLSVNLKLLPEKPAAEPGLIEAARKFPTEFAVTKFRYWEQSKLTDEQLSKGPFELSSAYSRLIEIEEKLLKALEASRIEAGNKEAVRLALIDLEGIRNRARFLEKDYREKTTGLNRALSGVLSAPLNRFFFKLRPRLIVEGPSVPGR